MDKFTIGSRAFFSDYEDFEPHDSDYIVFNEDPDERKKLLITRDGDEHTFIYKVMPKEEFIEFELGHTTNVAMAAMKLLVPEVAEYLGLTMEDLNQFDAVYQRLDRKHKYGKYIYDCYKENGDFTLTQEQRDQAYNLYKETRNYISNDKR